MEDNAQLKPDSAKQYGFPNFGNVPLQGQLFVSVLLEASLALFSRRLRDVSIGRAFSLSARRASGTRTTLATGLST